MSTLRSLRPAHAALFVVLVVAAVFRVLVAATHALPIDGDEAITGIMAERIQRGQELYTYFSSQSYNGAIEQYLQAGYFAVFDPAPSSFSLRVVQVAIGVVTTFAVYLLGRRVFPGRWWAVAAAGAFAAGPYWSVWLGTRSYGGYDTAQLMVVVALVAVFGASGFRVSSDVGAFAPVGPRVVLGPRSRARWVWSGVFGLAVGIAIWSGFSAFEVLAVAGLWMLPVVLTAWRPLVAAVVSVLVGGAPAIRWALVNPDRALSIGGQEQPVTTFTQRAELLFSTVGPKFTGLTMNDGVSAHRAWAFGIALGVVALVAIVVRHRGLWHLLTLRMSARRPIDLVIAAFPVAVLFYLLNDYSWYTGTPRYLMILYPIAMIAGVGVVRCVTGWAVRLAASRRDDVRGGAASLPARRRVLPVVVPAVVVLAVLAAFSARTLSFPRDFPPGGVQASDADFVRADEYLVDHGITKAYSNYWTATPATFLGVDAGMTVAPWGDAADKARPERIAVDRAQTFAYMTSNRSGPYYEPTLVRALKQHHVMYTRHVFGEVTVFTDLSVPVRPATLQLPG